MPRVRTLVDLRAEVRSRADVRDSYIDNPELDRLINAGLAKLYRILVDINRDYYISQAPVNVVAGTDNYGLPVDHWRTEAVDVQDGARWVALSVFGLSERLESQGAQTKDSARYRIAGSSLWLAPVPAWSGTLRHWYIPAPPVLSGGTPSWDGFAGFEEFCVLDAVLSIKSKMEEDTTNLMAQIAGLEKEIRGTAATRNDAEPPRVRDMDAEAWGRYPWS